MTTIEEVIANARGSEKDEVIAPSRNTIRWERPTMIISVDAWLDEQKCLQCVVNVSDEAFRMFRGAPIERWRDPIAEAVKTAIDNAAAQPKVKAIAESA